MHRDRPTRRRVLGGAGAMVVGSIAGGLRPRASASQAPGAVPDGPGPPLAPAVDLVNTLEFEEQARRRLAPELFARVAGGDRAPFDRITIRPRLLVPAVDLDLQVSLFGETFLAPIFVAPIAAQGTFHPDGEVATSEGAAAAGAGVVLSGRSSLSLADVTARVGAPFGYQVFASERSAPAEAARAVEAGCRIVCVSIGVAPGDPAGLSAGSSTADWQAVETIGREAGGAPVVVKGVTTPESARQAIDRGARGIIVSNYGGLAGPSHLPPILDLPDIVDAVGDAVPVLVDGSFRRGTDVLKALAFGAQAVLVGRPVIWGLAAYGAAGVQRVLEMLQTELGRYMAMSGKPNLALLDRSMLRVHRDRSEPAGGSVQGG